jgi:hypothetical protein
VSLPLICTRRIGAACETAQKSSPASHPVLPVTLIVRLDSDRQKLSVALHWPPEHWLKAWMAPLITTWLGFCPRPATLV